MIDESAWTGLREQLKALVGADIYESWFPRLRFHSVHGRIVRLSVPTRFLRAWITQHYLDRLTELWSTVAPDAEVQIVVRSAMVERRADAPVVHVASPVAPSLPRAAEPVAQTLPIEAAALGSPVDPAWTFATCCVGDSNRLAFAAAQQVANSYRAPVFNPLFIHGRPGLGKSRLLQAIANAAGGQRVLHLTGGRFVHGYLASLKDGSTNQFRRALREVDLLLVDDVQEVRGKLVLADFSYLLTALMEFGRQVVISADRPPADLEGFDSRTLSRLGGGLVAEIDVFDAALARDILAARVDALKVQDPAFAIEGAIVELVAQRCGRSGRDIEAAVNRLFAHAQLGCPLTLEEAERVLHDNLQNNTPRRVRIDEVQRAVAHHFHVSRDDILSQRRTANVVKPRQIAMYLAKTLTLHSLPEIGRRFGGRDHTTVLHAVRKIEGLQARDDDLAGQLSALKATITSEERR
ncbi:chromosomal replication initiator protein DnaA [Ancylobacter radicis]|uniref:Chromosomal replication initiator protein DnaA n=1 Tax=Ancylobacter radicis TaxID=2836179 RepID=A0ABS5R3H9_9HYPH|nr:chromosomal replication initiator protein DnaA [Ancylobacter radicis]MBS9476215.1 chromosomal replication initiator protein DnaA [Ancylobacter radicis]